MGLALAWAEHGLNLAQAARALRRGRAARPLPVPPLQGRRLPNPTAGANGKANENARQIESITILGRGREPALRAAVERGRILAEAQNFARDLGNEPANVLTPVEFAARAEKHGGRGGLECEVFGPDWMREQGMGALLGVGAGQRQGATLDRPALSGRSGERAGAGRWSARASPSIPAASRSSPPLTWTR